MGLIFLLIPNWALRPKENSRPRNGNTTEREKHELLYCLVHVDHRRQSSTPISQFHRDRLVLFLLRLELAVPEDWTPQIDAGVLGFFTGKLPRENGRRTWSLSWQASYQALGRYWRKRPWTPPPVRFFLLPFLNSFWFPRHCPEWK